MGERTAMLFRRSVWTNAKTGPPKRSVSGTVKRGSEDGGQGLVVIDVLAKQIHETICRLEERDCFNTISGYWDVCE
jgi:hypothetical protein